MPADPTLSLADKLVSVIRAGWTDRQDSDEVFRAKDPNVTDETVSAITGRKVFVQPIDKAVGPGTHGKTRYLHRINVLVVERYAGDGLPPEEWSDARVDFVYTRLVRGLDFGAAVQPVLNFTGRSVETTRIGDPIPICVVEYLTGLMLFWAEVQFEFGEELP